MKNNEILLQQLEQDFQKTQHVVLNLMKSFQAISSSLELEEVLKKIMHYAFSLFKTANAGYIQLYDEKSDQLIVKAYTGFSDDIRQFKVKVGESITGSVFRDGAVKLIYTEKDIYAHMSNMSEKNFQAIEKAQLFKHSIQSIMSAPVSFGSKRIGVMTFHCYDTEERLSETDLLLLQSFTTQAAIAIHNAQIHEDVQTSLNEITRLSKKLERTNTLLARRTDIHNLLTRLSLENKGLKVILSEMNQLLDANVMYADYLEQKHQPPNRGMITKYIDDIFLLFATKTKPAFVSIQDLPGTEYYVYPLRSGQVFLGCLIVEEGHSLSALDRLVIEQGAPILSLEVMKQRSQTEIRYKKTYELFQQFLKITTPQQAEIAAKELGIHLDSYLQTALIELNGPVDLSSLENEALLLLEQLKKRLPMDNILLFSYNNKITFFYASPTAQNEEQITHIIQRSITWWNERYTTTARVGMSSGHYSPGQAQENQAQAEKALLHLKRQNKKGVLHYRDIGISRLFIDHPSEDIDSFLRETLSSLWTEKEKNEELFHTLFMYVQHNRSMSQTAKDLHIHTNTLYHRIKKIEELLDVDFNQHDDYLKIQLAVYLCETFFE